MNNDFFHRTELLVGTEGMARLASARVILFGVGGVGSWCAESLIRSGIGHLTIVDSDCVDVTNINRQLPATTETVGQPKVEVLRARLLTINPEAEIIARQERYTPQTAESFGLENYDYVIDAIDSLPDKADLILRASGLKTKLFSSMGAAFKMDPTRIQVAEFWKVAGCPLAAALRNRFKRNKTFPKRKFRCVFSDEMKRPKDAKENGTVVHITAVFGFTLAGLVIKDVIEN